MTTSSTLTHDPETDLFVGPDGSIFVECRFEAQRPVMIRIDQDVWRAKHNGVQHHLNWDGVDLPLQIIDALKEATTIKLHKSAPSYLSMVRHMIGNLSQEWKHNGLSQVGDFSAIDDSCLVKLFAGMNKHAASTFRELYRTLAVRSLKGTSLRSSRLLAEIKVADSFSGALPSVRQWDAARGALTTSELERLRAHLQTFSPDESNHDHFIRVYLRTAVAVGKRAGQLLHAPADALTAYSEDERYQKFIQIPGGKSQRNEAPGLWPISDDLYIDLKRYSDRAEVAVAQKVFGYFFVTPLTTQSRIEGPRHSGTVAPLIGGWLRRNNVVSPRTGEVLKVTTTRLRHTVATQMARKGYSKGDIQAMLEHMSDGAALSYLDAVGNDMTPALERVDEALGGVFADLSDAFFKGKIIDKPKGRISKPIVRPDPTNIAIVGQCGSAESCPKHPFFSCYNGCPFFLKFRDTDEDANRAFVQKEYEKWRSSEPSATQSKALDDFARIERGIVEARQLGAPKND
ncbi:tyrosine-type recombinase/integrase [Epibacterium sp. SM1969]|uniref:Tyrosine-type recombinase/integrase n=1 Tax=Tritonibacter aquimaris TaxID=2663379 RepID=A0A844ALW5_9RHOB|nr:tyrosine-type recombinase/integrase [Tritonibacter aquimaris]MQY42799.1 tyrosine-type recombinase/integrase [Tritonibacter aquimaris]